MLRNGVLHLRTGVRWQAEVPLADVAAIREPESHAEDARKSLNLSVLGQPSLILCARTGRSRGRPPSQDLAGRIGKAQAIPR